jgi:oligopeptide/dipeptide ABC transporter ATP-binding protein
MEVDGLGVSFATPDGPLQAVDGISFSLERGDVLGLVGESGCGKSATASALCGLLPPGARTSGSARLDGRELLSLSEPGWRAVRGRRISMVFQDPMSSLNPLLSVGEHLVETLRTHRDLTRDAARADSVDWLRRVGIPDPEARLASYPHELSGGMRQRVMIALALCSGPDLLVADEPTTALDVTIQAQILDLLASLRRELGMTMIFITHDLGVVERVADRIAVMYAGRIAEEGPAERILASPRHPYTRGLLDSVPGFRPRTGRLPSIAGAVPSPRDWPSGCRFHPRCPNADATCREGVPDAPGPEGGAACFHPVGTP